MWRLEASQLGALFDALHREGYEILGPKLEAQAIVYGTLSSVKSLPQGWTDVQEAGSYRLKRRDDAAYFGYNLSPHTWKTPVLPPRQRLWKATQVEGSFRLEPEPIEVKKLALLGIRPCELRALELQAEVLGRGEHVDPHFQAAEAGLLRIAVQCGQAGGTCFCTSMDTGPRADDGFDLALTERVGPGFHYFVVECQSPLGEQILAQLPLREAAAQERQEALAQSQEVAGQMGRQLDAEGLPELLDEAFDHPRWEEVASRCLSCANCTMSCPTCFCTQVEDLTDLTGQHAERWRSWDSCFHQDFSYIAGGALRRSVKSRYRQWLSHKLGTWVSQFGSSGCVGCGRCITWCPVGIDITEEAAALREAVGEIEPR